MLNALTRRISGNTLKSCRKLQKRMFLSPAYYCEEVWENRLKNPIIQKVKVDELYIELDQKYSKTKTISAVDVDIFANSLTNSDYADELIDLIHKLRLSADSSSTLDSTHHAVVRCLTKFGRNDDLVNILDDRLNYGIFLDNYTANLLLDTFWKEKNYLSGARLAGQLMLQEDFSHPLVANLSLLHCYSYLLNPGKWPEEVKPVEPEEEVKIRVKYLRNPYFDDHFDLRDPNQIIGKTIAMICQDKKDPLEVSFYALGKALHGKTEEALKTLGETREKKIFKDIFNILPEDNEVRKHASGMQGESGDLSEILQSRVKQAERAIAEKDVAKQCENFSKWEEERKLALEAQQDRLMKAQRIENITELQKALKDKETKLWFFENEEQIELAIAAKKRFPKKRWFGKKKKPKKIDETYVPPEIVKKLG